jgi:hypothetical protein
MRFPTRALRREDLPTLGRPTIAITGRRFIGGILGFSPETAIHVRKHAKTGILHVN